MADLFRKRLNASKYEDYHCQLNIVVLDDRVEIYMRDKYEDYHCQLNIVVLDDRVEIYFRDILI